MPHRVYDQLWHAFHHKVNISSEWIILRHLSILSGLEPKHVDCCINSCVTFMWEYICPCEGMPLLYGGPVFSLTQILSNFFLPPPHSLTSGLFPECTGSRVASVSSLTSSNTKQRLWCLQWRMVLYPLQHAGHHWWHSLLPPLLWSPVWYRAWCHSRQLPTL